MGAGSTPCGERVTRSRSRKLSSASARHPCGGEPNPFRCSVRVATVPHRLSCVGRSGADLERQTYAHVLGNDDRDAAEHADIFLLGEGWSLAEKVPQGDEPVECSQTCYQRHENGPRKVSGGRFT